MFWRASLKPQSHFLHVNSAINTKASMILQQSTGRFISSKKKAASIPLYYIAMRMEQSVIMCFIAANTGTGFIVSAVIALPTSESVDLLRLSRRLALKKDF
jgi:hypothetical protein